MTDLDSIRPHLRDELEPSKKRGFYFCPVCGSGNGPNHTPAFSIEADGIHGKCFSCGFYGDIFDLAAKRDKVLLSEATRSMREKYGAKVDFSPMPSPVKAETNSTAAPHSDYASVIEADHVALIGSDGESYLKQRGFSEETMKRFKLGYERSHYFGGLGKSVPAISIPYGSERSYLAWRAIGEKAFDKPSVNNAGEEPVFNLSSLYSGGPVFVVESQLCAISIEQEGGKAIAIGGSGERKLIKQIKENPPAGTLILSLDNDERGAETSIRLQTELDAMGVFCYSYPVQGVKDPNELLMQSPDALRSYIAEALHRQEEAFKAAEAQRVDEYNAENASNALSDFFKQIERSQLNPAISTGFKGLDTLLEGGLYSGLYIIGAITSLGKTTFCLQIADSIAAAGQDVLFFSLEMAKQELIAKSLSRITFELSRSKTAAKTTLGLLSGKRYESYTRDELNLINSAVSQYSTQSAGHIWFIEGIGNIGVEDIRVRVERHISITGRKPVVFIDYLQILAPAQSDYRLSDKQNTDKSVLELKRLSRDKEIPVIGISSLNRDNYTEPINNAAFKESGAIEYSSDVLIGLQFDGMDYQDGEKDGDRTKRIRELIKDQQRKGNEGGAESLQLKILKFRNGKKGTSLLLNYTPWFNHYEESVTNRFTQVDSDGSPFSTTQKKRKVL